MPAFEVVKIGQITESRISNVVAMLPPSLQSGMSPIRFLRRIISLDTLRPGVLVSEAPPKPRALLAAHVPLTQDPLITEMLQRNDAHQDADSKAVCPRPMSRVLFPRSRSMVTRLSGRPLVFIGRLRGKVRRIPPHGPRLITIMLIMFHSTH